MYLCLTRILCVCKTRAEKNEEMVACDNSNCKLGKWFHLGCMCKRPLPKLASDPWFCSAECERASSDGVENYTRATIWLFLNICLRKLASKYNHGEWLLLLDKFDLIQFHNNNHYKYAILTHQRLAGIAGLYESNLGHRLKWNRNVNINGGVDNNVPVDKYMEFLNRIVKGIVKGPILRVVLRNSTNTY